MSYANMSAERAELLHDLDTFGMGEAEELEDCLLEERRERVQELAEAGDPHTITLLDQYMAEDWKAVLVLLARGEDEKAHEAIDKALERAMKRVVT